MPVRAFTLIELLVVVTVAVVLLAMLMPALDQAIYQAELARCSANLKGIAVSTSTYAASHRGYYPHRPGVLYAQERDPGWYAEQLTDPRNGHDDRRTFEGYLPLSVLQCPLVGRVELSPQFTKTTSMVFCNYFLWFGWQYHSVPGPVAAARGDGVARQRGMFKLGDRFEFDGDRFNVLASDVDEVNFTGSFSWASHPDKAGVLRELVLQDRDDPAVGATRDYPQLSLTWSKWDSRVGGGATTWRRGAVDRNVALDDGSVHRYNNVVMNADGTPDERMTLVSAFSRRIGPNMALLPKP